MIMVKKQHTRKYVETVEARDEEEQGTESFRAETGVHALSLVDGMRLLDFRASWLTIFRLYIKIATPSVALCSCMWMS